MNPSIRCSSIIPSATNCAKSLSRPTSSTRYFSTTPQHGARNPTRARRAMFRWLFQQGENFRDPLPNSTNYLGAYNAAGQLKRVVEVRARDAAEKGTDPDAELDQSSGPKSLPPETSRDFVPFPLNRKFVSQPVLTDELREMIWKAIMVDGKSVREVSSELGVDMNRVAAVVRLKEVEREWERAGKSLAKPYHDAVMSMLPKTEYNPQEMKRHESINDLPVHAATGQQIFHPTSESRHFTRVDAAKVFDDKLLPADERIPHPEMVINHREYKADLPRGERQANKEAREEEEHNKRQEYADRKAKREALVKKVDTGRWEYRIQPINVDAIGKDGRGAKGVGWRYGVPLMDRSRGQVKIPTRVQ